MIKTVLVCQNRTCKLSGSAQVLKAFQSYSMPDVAILGSGCLAQCGNGAVVVILPGEILYTQVVPNQVKAIVEQHLLND